MGNQNKGSSLLHAHLMNKVSSFTLANMMLMRAGGHILLSDSVILKNNKVEALTNKKINKTYKNNYKNLTANTVHTMQ